MFFYFTDVNPGDGGLVVLPGSHKSEFERLSGIFFQNMEGPNHPLHSALVNVTPRAGDVVILSESTVHGVFIWKSVDRDRRFLTLSYKTQYFTTRLGQRHSLLPDDVWERLSPETQELAQTASYEHIKSIVSSSSTG